MLTGCLRLAAVGGEVVILLYLLACALQYRYLDYLLLQVCAYPWGPIPTAVTEAVALARKASAAAAGSSPDATAAHQPQQLSQYHQQHEDARSSLLSKQQQRWWQEVDYC
jgi:hypothetical protein